MQNDILMNMDRQHVTLLVLLNLSAAFDTVDHTILIDRLQHDFGIKDNALKWFLRHVSLTDLNESLWMVFYLTASIFRMVSLKAFVLAHCYLHCYFIVQSDRKTSTYADDTQLYHSNLTMKQ